MKAPALPRRLKEREVDEKRSALPVVLVDYHSRKDQPFGCLLHQHLRWRADTAAVPPRWPP
jgi:hypothetical protein